VARTNQETQLEVLYAVRHLTESLNTVTRRLEDRISEQQERQEKALEKHADLIKQNRERLDEMSVEVAEQLRENLGSDASLKVAQKIIDSLRQGMYQTVNGEPPPAWMRQYQAANRDDKTQQMATIPAQAPTPPSTKTKTEESAEFILKSGKKGVSINIDSKTKLVLITLLITFFAVLGAIVKEAFNRFTHQPDDQKSRPTQRE
jgi:hypothetical protein